MEKYISSVGQLNLEKRINSGSCSTIYLINTIHSLNIFICNSFLCLVFMEVYKVFVLTCVIINTMFAIFANVFSSFEDIMCHFGHLFFLLLLLSLVFYYLWKTIFIKTKLKKVSSEDLKSIENYYKVDKDNYLLSIYQLYFLFDKIDDICMCFYKVKKNILNFGSIYLEEELDFIKTCDNKEMITLYEKSKQAIDAIYKYYDKNGKRKI